MDYIKKAKLITEGEFNLNYFKQIYKDLEWKRVPRELGPRHSSFFYVGYSEDDKHRIKIKIRPTMYMSVEETYKGFTKDGKEGKRPGDTYEFGTTVEVKIDESVLDKIKAVAKEDDGEKLQKVSW